MRGARCPARRPGPASGTRAPAPLPNFYSPRMEAYKMAPWHSAKHHREAWGGIGGVALAPELRWHHPEPARVLLPWAAHGGRGTLLHLHERKAPTAAGGPTGRGGTAVPAWLWPWCCTGPGPADLPPHPRAGRPRCPLPPRVTPAPGKAGGPAGRTSEEPGHQAAPELFNVMAQERVRCLPLFYVLHV
ncbi:unnamed protein product [Coccothraustes coccothraustes]